MFNIKFNILHVPNDPNFCINLTKAEYVRK